jgi:polyhydroxybutyrate depolymerase
VAGPPATGLAGAGPRAASGLGNEARRVMLVPQSLDVEGRERHFLLAEPSGDPSVVLLSLHGSGSSARRQAGLHSMDRFSSAGAVAVFPEGGLPRRSGYEWDLEGDVEFLRVLVGWLLARYPRANRRVSVAGMSGGARMASRFASLQPESVRVLGAVAGLRAPARTPLEHPVRVVAFHGTADTLNPLAGGGTARWNESVPDAAAAWARALGLPAEPTRKELTAHLTRMDFGDPDDAAAVTLFISRGAGHTWPGSRLPLLLRPILGRTSNEIDATAEIWRAATTP